MALIKRFATQIQSAWKEAGHLAVNDGRLNRHLIYLVCTFLILLQVFVLLFSTSTYGGADNIGHYQIAKYSFKYPRLFLDLWGKPVYTTLSAPFAQLGYGVARAFNILLFIVALLFTARVSEKILKGSSLFVMILAAFSPVYYFLATTCLTEVLFSLTIVASVFLFTERRFMWAAILISFIPFVRTEGVVFLPVFLLALLLKKQYKSIVFLLTGTIFYTLVGFLVFKDLLWLIHQMPYSMGDSIYGHGSLLHFIEHRNEIFGFPMVVLIVLGLVFGGWDIWRSQSLRSDQAIGFLLIAGSWITYFAAHSYVWWKGTGGSLGLIRVMGGIVPLAALTAIQGFRFFSLFFRGPVLGFVLMVLFAFAQLVWFFQKNNPIVHADPTEQLMKKSADFLRFNEPEKKIFYFNPVLIHYLETDPYDITRSNWWVADRQQPSNSMEWGDVLVWDAHFGPNEGGVSLENVEKDPYLKKIKSFYPVEKITVLGGYDYSIQIYKKSTEKHDSVMLSDKAELKLSFEDYVNEQVKEIDGVKIWEMDNRQEFSPNMIFSPQEIVRYEVIEFAVELQFKAPEKLDKDEVLLVLSLDNEGENLRYEKADLVSSDAAGWEKATLQVRMSAKIPETAKFGIYVWNKDKRHFYIKDLTVKVLSY